MSQWDAIAGMPMPVPGDGVGKEIQDWAIELIAYDESHSHFVRDLIIADIREKKRQGILKYGRPLRASDGRDTLKELYYELLDAHMYALKGVAEAEASQKPDKAEWMEYFTDMADMLRQQLISVRMNIYKVTHA